MENRDKKALPNFATSGSLGMILRKNAKKKDENVTCRGDFEKQKKTKQDRGKPRDFLHSIRYGANGSGRRPKSGAYWH